MSDQTNQPNMHSTPMSLTARTCVCGHPAHPGRVCNAWVSYRPGALHGFPCACNMNALPTPESQLGSMRKLLGQQQSEIAELRKKLEAAEKERDIYFLAWLQVSPRAKAVIDEAEALERGTE